MAWKWSDLEIGDKVKIRRNKLDKFNNKTLVVTNIYKGFNNIDKIEVSDGKYFEEYYIDMNGEWKNIKTFEVVELKED